MATTLIVRDETSSGETLQESILEFLTERITVQELIRSRVYQEVKDYNVKRPEVFHGLVQPTDAEQALNGYRIRRPRQIDWKQQYAAALEAFKENRVIILIDGQQAEGLDDEIVVGPETHVTFLKLVPLVGG
jgi:hypothetical protein